MPRDTYLLYGRCPFGCFFFWRWRPEANTATKVSRGFEEAAQSDVRLRDGGKLLRPEGLRHLHKKSRIILIRLFLSKSQTWHIITRQRVYHRRRRISSRVSVYLPATWWYTRPKARYTRFRTDDMQFLTKLMIYKAYALILVRLCAIIECCLGISRCYIEKHQLWVKRKLLWSKLHSCIIYWMLGMRYSIGIQKRCFNPL